MAELDEPIALSAYDPQWPALYRAEAERIAAVLPSGVEVEHIGSTSIPGLIAKATIDVMIGLPPHTDSQPVRAGLRSLGYEDLGEAGVPGRLYFRLRDARSYNAHVVSLDGPIWKANVALREYLRTHGQEAQLYADAKRSAIEGGATMLLEYSERKREFVEGLVGRALAWFHERRS